jgi:hypothetical protein
MNSPRTVPPPHVSPRREAPPPQENKEPKVLPSRDVTVPRRVMPSYVWFGGIWLIYIWYSYASRANRAPLTTSDWVWLAVECGIPVLVGWGLWNAFARSRVYEKIKAVPAPSMASINPLQWRHEHQLAWLVACALGAVVGSLYGFNRWVYTGPDQSQVLIMWLQQPHYYWSLALCGAVTAALLFYLVRLLKS